jgi:FkbM family methyltransferase
MKFDFIEIGTAYFDTEMQKNDGRKGLSIDVIQEYLDVLPDNPNVTKFCCAISDKYGEYVVYKPDFLDDPAAGWLSGCVSVLKPHKHVIEHCEITGKNYSDHVTERVVKVIPASELIKLYNISSVEYLKIDTEGHDVIILNNWLDCCENNKELYPKKILFESKDLTDPFDLKKMNERLIKLNYTLTFYKYDTEAILQN